MAITYEPIASTTLTGTASDVTFSSISGSYTDLILVTNIKGTVTNYTRVQFNGDTGSNYSLTDVEANGSTVASYRSSNVTYSYLQGGAAQTTTDFSYNSITHFMNYSNTTTNKTFLSRSNAAGSSVDMLVALWRSTAAITSIKLYPNTGSFASGSTFTLYGVKAA